MSDADDLPLFTWSPAPSAPKPIEQAVQLERVSSRIARSIVEFCKAHVGEQFHAAELRAHVEKQCGETAPGSADRVLRDLRQKAVIAYRVVSRSDSRYLIEGA